MVDNKIFVDSFMKFYINRGGIGENFKEKIQEISTYLIDYLTNQDKIVFAKKLWDLFDDDEKIRTLITTATKENLTDTDASIIINAVIPKIAELISYHKLLNKIDEINSGSSRDEVVYLLHMYKDALQYSMESQRVPEGIKHSGGGGVQYGGAFHGPPAPAIPQRRGRATARATSTGAGRGRGGRGPATPAHATRADDPRARATGAAQPAIPADALHESDPTSRLDETVVGEITWGRLGEFVKTRVIEILVQQQTSASEALDQAQIERISATVGASLSSGVEISIDALGERMGEIDGRMQVLITEYSEKLATLKERVRSDQTSMSSAHTSEIVHIKDQIETLTTNLNKKMEALAEEVSAKAQEATGEQSTIIHSTIANAMEAVKEELTGTWDIQRDTLGTHAEQLKALRYTLESLEAQSTVIEETNKETKVSLMALLKKEEQERAEDMQGVYNELHTQLQARLHDIDHSMSAGEMIKRIIALPPGEKQVFIESLHGNQVSKAQIDEQLELQREEISTFQADFAREMSDSVEKFRGELLDMNRGLQKKVLDEVAEIDKLNQGVFKGYTAGLSLHNIEQLIKQLVNPSTSRTVSTSSKSQDYKAMDHFIIIIDSGKDRNSVGVWNKKELMKTFNRDAIVLLDTLNSDVQVASRRRPLFEQILKEYRAILFMHVHLLGYHRWLMRFDPEEPLHKDYNSYGGRGRVGDHNTFDKARENKDLSTYDDNKDEQGFMYSYIYNASPLRPFLSYLEKGIVTDGDYGPGPVPADLKKSITDVIEWRRRGFRKLSSGGVAI